MDTQVYMSPEYRHRGDLSTKVDAFAFGLVVLETLTGYTVYSPAPGHRNLISIFDQELDTVVKLLAHLDRRACWDQHKQERIGSAPQVLQGLESERTVGPLVTAEASEKECCICLNTEEVGKLLTLVPCGHRCVCDECSALVVGHTCPVCRTETRQVIRVFD
jgi:hypothetical protein